MKKIELYGCDFCNFTNESEEVVKLHELVCPKNPINQPCSHCANMCIGMGCLRQVQMDAIDGKKVLCAFFKDGTPKTPLEVLVDK